MERTVSLLDLDPAGLSAVRDEIATTFFDGLRSLLTDEQWTELGVTTRAETDDGICHSHDHLDANQVMIDAYEMVTGLAWGCDEEELGRLGTLCYQLTGGAWNLAKARMKEIPA